jgi:CRISPR/Cas system-associated exonuclease Cas4 (RecB family)
MPCFIFSLKVKNFEGGFIMSEGTTSNSILEDFLHCMKILRYMRVRNIEEAYEKREEYIRLMHESQKVYDELEASLDEKQRTLLMKFSDITGDMDINKSFFHYMHGFDDCQLLYELFRELAKGNIRIPLIEEQEGLRDYTPDATVSNEACDVSLLEDKIHTLRKALNDYVSPENLCDKNILEKSRELDDLLLRYHKEIKRNSTKL